MAILAQIRNRPIFLIIIIGMALFAFVLSGVFDGSGGPVRNSIGSVNGEEISNKAFSRLLEGQNKQNSTLKSVQTVWDNIVKAKVYEDQIEKAGIVVGEKEIWDEIVRSSKNDQRFKNEDNIFDENKLKEYVATLKDNKNTKQGKNNWINWVNNENNIKSFIAQRSYNELVKSSFTASAKEGERTYYADNSKANIQYVYQPYSSIADTEITISDSEITNYMNTNAIEYSTEATTEIDVVKFDINPSTEDKKAIKSKIEGLINDATIYNTSSKADELRVGLKNTKDVKDFINQNSDIAFADKLYLEKDLPSAVFTDLSTKPVGSVYGPYEENNYYKVARLINNKGLKSANSSHILIAYAGATRADSTVTRTREEAQKFAKVVRRKLTSTNFSDIAKEFSDGQSAPKGGNIGWFDEKSQLAQEYKDFIINNRKGSIDIVESGFGFHIIKIEDTKIESGLDLGILALKIDASTTTENEIFQNVEIFASRLQKGEKMLDAIKDKNYKIISTTNLKEFDEKITGLNNQRSIVRWTFDKDTKIGDSKRFELNDGGYAVVALKNRYTKGLLPINKARAKVSPILSKQKKAALIRKKLNGTTIDELAKSIGKSVNTQNDISISNPQLKIGGRDLDLVGALLYMKENDVKIIDGNSGVYAMNVLKKTKAFDLKTYTTYSNNITTELQKRSAKVYDALKESCDIEDNKALLY
ncbi:MAG: peptidylprolyl isomerase [Flavobacteriaceae bacterium]